MAQIHQTDQSNLQQTLSQVFITEGKENYEKKLFLLAKKLKSDVAMVNEPPYFTTE